MSADFQFIFPLPNGLHARPASHLEAVARRFSSTITLVHERTGTRANARSVLSMVSADVQFNDPCRIEVVGGDEQAAIEAVLRFVETELPHCDPPLPKVENAANLPLPRSLVAAGLKQHLRGNPVCGGVGIGKAIVIGNATIPEALELQRSTDTKLEHKRADAAVSTVSQSINSQLGNGKKSAETEVLRAHAAILRDVSLLESIGSLIEKHHTAQGAIAGACRSFVQTLKQSSSAYLRERVLDVEDICLQLLGQLTDLHIEAVKLMEPTICMAENLTPGQFLAMDRSMLRGLILSDGGTTSHTVILARSMNIPTLTGVPRARFGELAGQEAIVDGELGLATADLSEPVRRYYLMEQSRIDQRRQTLRVHLHHSTRTVDGHAIEIAGNIASGDEAAVAFENGAEGIGLFRTEMLFMDRDAAPSEAEQSAIYQTAATAGAGKPVIIRTMDIGGDKPAEFMNLPTEENPFLGFRGARIYGEFNTTIKDQLRAMLRASVHGNVKILVPMICCLEEVRSIRDLVAECAAELSIPPPPLGVMLEIPSLVMLMPELCEEVDFFSIGSNDLTQYFLAADRANPKVASLYSWAHPAFLRLLKSLIDQAKAAGKWIGLCGEMGDSRLALPLLVGLGLDEISASIPRVASLKSTVSQMNFERCKALVSDALRCKTRSEVESLLEKTTVMDPQPLITSAMVVSGDCRTKAEVIKLVADQLFVTGRTAKPQQLEEAIWKREETYSTGFGFGFSLPHCKSDDLDANSIIIARLKSPVDWGSLDGEPVSVVILLAIRSSESSRAHMKIFAMLSRLVMRDEFRDRLRNEQDPQALVTFLEESLPSER